MADFTVTTDLAPIRALVIEANFQELQRELTAGVEVYRNMVVTEDGISAAKKDLANIRRVGKQIDEVRMAVKREYAKPYQDFEAKCKELKGVLTGAETNLDGQIKGFETKRREEKLAALEGFFNEKLTPEAEGFICFDKISAMFPKWVNAGYDMETAKADIARTLATVQGGVASLRGYSKEFRSALLQKFRETLDLGKTMAYYEELNDQAEQEALREQQRAQREAERREAARKAAEEREARIAAENAEKARQGAQAIERETAPAAPEIAAQPAEGAVEGQNVGAPEKKVYTFRIYATAEEAKAVVNFLRERQIQAAPKRGAE